MTAPTRTSVACRAVLAALIIGLSLPNPAVGNKETREAFVPVGELPDGLSVVYVFMKHWSGRGLLQVFANGRPVALMSPGKYFPLLVRPGELTLTSTTIWPDGPGDRDHGELTLDVEPGRQYYVKYRLRPGLSIAKPDEVRKELPERALPVEPAFFGLYHSYQADVFLALAASQDEAGNREAAKSALRKAAEQYDSASSGFRLPIPKRKWKFLGSLAAIIYVGTAYPAEVYRRQQRVREGLAQERAEDASFNEARLAVAGDAATFAARMEELSDMVDAAHACYVREDEPSLEQCWVTATPETP